MKMVEDCGPWPHETVYSNLDRIKKLNTEMAHYRDILKQMASIITRLVNKCPDDWELADLVVKLRNSL